MKTKTPKKTPVSQDDTGTSYDMNGVVITPTMDGPDVIAEIYNQKPRPAYDDQVNVPSQRLDELGASVSAVAVPKCTIGH